uniref:Cellular retinoic acid binding protein 1 n=1 Tax=Papio anubis TaxID=9555 RepID=A0A8I5N8M4_PAPAN
MPNFAGTWKMRSSENFDELLKALGVNAMLRKVAVAAASKPHVEIRQDGDQFYIKTSTTVRTTEINFKVGEGFEEETVDGRKCRSLATWENENKIHCTQTLLEGDGPKTYWTRELANDELILVGPLDPEIILKFFQMVPEMDPTNMSSSLSLSEKGTICPGLKLEQKTRDDSSGQGKSLLNGWQERGVAQRAE